MFIRSMKEKFTVCASCHREPNLFYGGWARKVVPAGWCLSLTVPGRGGGGGVS